MPFTEKHPFAKLSPLANVEVAPPVTAKLCTDTPPANVEVELVPSTERKPCIVEVPTTSPCSVVVALPFARNSEPPSVMPPEELILLLVLKNLMSPVLAPWIISAFVVEALNIGFAPPRIKLPEASTGIWFPIAFCAGANPPTVFAFTVYADAYKRCLGERLSNDSAPSPGAQVGPTRVATSTFKYTVSLSWKL